MYYYQEKEPGLLAKIGATVVILAILFVICKCALNINKQYSNKDGAWKSQSRAVYTKVVEIKGHEYIVMDGVYSGNIVHSESCPCKNK